MPWDVARVVAPFAFLSDFSILKDETSLWWQLAYTQTCCSASLVHKTWAKGLVAELLANACMWVDVWLGHINDLFRVNA